MKNLEIDSVVLSHLKTPAKECTGFVFPHPSYQPKFLDPSEKQIILFEDWEKTYKAI
jgi:hypothetical protein